MNHRSRSETAGPRYRAEEYFTVEERRRKNIPALVSIVIPTFNSAQFLVTAIESLLSQTYSRTEILVVDDGSTDESRELLAPYIESHSVRYLYQKNQGAAAARNAGILQSAGDYIAFLDADDEFLPEMIERCVEELEKTDCDLVSVDNFRIAISDGGEPVVTHQEYDWIERPPEDLFLCFLSVGGIGGVHKAIFKRCVFDQVGLLDHNLAVYEDLDLWLRISKAGLRWQHIREKLVKCYRRGAGSSLFTSSALRNLDCRVKILHRYGEEAIGASTEMRDVVAQQYWDFGRTYLQDHFRYMRALRCLLTSLRLDMNLRRLLGSIKGATDPN